MLTNTYVSHSDTEFCNSCLKKCQQIFAHSYWCLGGVCPSWRVFAGRFTWGEIPINQHWGVSQEPRDFGQVFHSHDMSLSCFLSVADLLQRLTGGQGNFHPGSVQFPLFQAFPKTHKAPVCTHWWNARQAVTTMSSSKVEKCWRLLPSYTQGFTTQVCSFSRWEQSPDPCPDYTGNDSERRVRLHRGADWGCGGTCCKTVQLTEN